MNAMPKRSRASGSQVERSRAGAHVLFGKGAERLSFSRVPRDGSSSIDADEALRECRRAGCSGSFSISEEAHARAHAAGHSPADLRHALANSTICRACDRGFELKGPTLDGTELELRVVLLNGGVSVV